MSSPSDQPTGTRLSHGASFTRTTRQAPRHTSPPPALQITAGALGATLVACWGEYPEAAHGLIGARNGHLVHPLLHGVDTVPGDTACTAQVPDKLRARALDRAPDGITVGASFHVHLGRPAFPTDHDGDRLASQPHLPLLIISLQDPDAPDIRAWWLTHNNAVEVPLQLTNPDPQSLPKRR